MKEIPGPSGGGDLEAFHTPLRFKPGKACQCRLLALRDMLRRAATSVATGGIAEVVEQPPFERTTLVTHSRLGKAFWKC